MSSPPDTFAAVAIAFSQSDGKATRKAAKISMVLPVVVRARIKCSALGCSTPARAKRLCALHTPCWDKKKQPARYCNALGCFTAVKLLGAVCRQHDVIRSKVPPGGHTPRFQFAPVNRLDPSFMEKGFTTLQQVVDEDSIADLLAMHQRVLPTPGAGESVHHRRGCAIRRIVLPGDPLRLTSETGLKNYPTKMLTDEVEITAVRKARASIAAVVGWAPDTLGYTYAMLSYPGQEVPQDWHQDSPHMKLATMLHLTAAKSTQFLKYPGRDFMSMAKHRRMAHIRKIWTAATARDAATPTCSTGRPRRNNVGAEKKSVIDSTKRCRTGLQFNCFMNEDNTVGEIPKGGLVLFNSGHLHRQPHPPALGDPPRCTLFQHFVCGNEEFHTDAVTVNAENWEAEWIRRDTWNTTQH
jgi:hypothetical protein